jgi:hypothetical protein
LRANWGEIYAIRWNGGCYVGQSRALSTNRWAEHLGKLRRGEHHNRQLQAAFWTAGIHGLSFSILESGLPFEDLDDREGYWTETLDAVNAPPKKKTREDKINAALDLLKSGCKYRDIRDRLGLSLGTISTINKLLGDNNLNN